VSILIDETTRVLVQGITGAQGTRDTGHCLDYGTRIVCGVTPGKGGQEVHGVPVYDSVVDALAEHEVDAALLFVPPMRARDGVLESLHAGIKLIVSLAEFVPLQDTAMIAATARQCGAVVVGCNTNGIISPGKCKLGGIGGDTPYDVYVPGPVGVVSRSGGMSAELALTLKQAGLGVTTSISMGGDVIPGTSMVEYVKMFVDDPETKAILIFGEPGTQAEYEVADYIRSGECAKPLVALLAGEFQENYPVGIAFGHVAAMISDASDTVSVKRQALADAGALVAQSLDEVPTLLKEALK
jgi:succinyl-CoA synthetase alpha subunit